MKIERASLTELSEVVSFLIGKFHAEYADQLPPADYGKVVLYIGEHINRGVVFLCRSDAGELVGLIAGMVSSPWFSTQKHVSEGVFFVLPEARGSRAAVLLINALKGFAFEQQMRLYAGVTIGQDLESKDRFFDRNGLERIGGIYRSKE